MKDTLGRNNRKLEDRKCIECGEVFRPIRSGAKYCSRTCAWKNNGGHNQKPACWWKNGRGYIEGKIWIGDVQIRVKQHRYAMEGILGRPLSSSEDVHHINGIKNDNRPENLEVLDHSDHAQKTNSQREYKKGYKLNLSKEQREQRSKLAIATKLYQIGQAAKRNKATS